MSSERRDPARQLNSTPVPDFALEDLATFEREYTIGRISQRQLMLDLVAILWLLNIAFALLAGQFNEGSLTAGQDIGRLVAAVTSLVITVLALTVVRRFDDQRTLQFVGTLAVVALLMAYWLGTLGPGALAGMFVAQMSVAFYVAQFFRIRMLTAVMLLITALAALGVAVNYGDPETPHLLSQTVLLMTVIWTVAYSLFSFKNERARALDEAERVAFSEPLTGLPNTRMLRRRAAALLDSRNERIHGQTGLLLIDLDGFRAANTLRGHLAGDTLLCAVADAVVEAAGDDALVARTGSDEFAVLLHDVSRSEVNELGERVRDAVLKAIDRSELSAVPMDASYGVAISGEDGVTIDDLLRTADNSLYLRKAAHEREPSRRVPAPMLVQRAPKPYERPAVNSSPPFPNSRRDEFRWSNRPLSIRVTAAYWLISSISIVVALSLPDSPSELTTGVWLVAAFSVLTAIVRYFLPESTRVWQRLADLAVATVALSVIIAITGRSASPTTAIALLVIVYVGRFMNLRLVIPTTVVFIVVILTPVLLDPGATFYIFDAVTLIGGVVIVISLVAMLYYNHYYLERAQLLTVQLASLDPRTGAFNRRAFEDRMRQELDRLSYGDRDALAVVMLDLGNFKSVSASQGRPVGDALLTSVARTLIAASREEDCVARLGGDEFAVVAPGVDAESARALAQRLVAAVREALDVSELAGNDKVRPSAGFALYGMHGRTTDELVTAADIALTATKTAGRDPERVSTFVVAL